MKRFKIVLSVVVLLTSAGICFSQTTKPPQFVRSSAAYAEVLLKQTELAASLEDLLVAYTLEYPKVKEIQFEMGKLKSEMDKLFLVKETESQKLTLALGKLIVRKVELEGVLWNLSKQYDDAHPDVKKAKRKILVYESAIKDVLF